MLDDDTGLTLNAEMHAIDVDHAMHYICPACGGACTYRSEPSQSGGNPHAFIVCLNEDCGWETEF